MKRPPRPPFVRGSDTSKAAADYIAGSVATMERKILHCIRSAPDGMTCDALEVLLGIKHQTCSARCRDLRRDGLIFDSGERRLTRSGCKARVYVSNRQAIREAKRQGFFF